MPDYCIEHITRTNTALLTHVAEDAFDEDIEPDKLDHFLDDSSHALFIAVLNDQVVGQIRGMVHRQPDQPLQLYVDNLGVAPEAKRQGIATALFAALKLWGRDQGCKSFWVATEIENDEGRAFYASLGLKDQTMSFYEADL